MRNRDVSVSRMTAPVLTPEPQVHKRSTPIWLIFLGVSVACVLLTIGLHLYRGDPLTYTNGYEDEGAHFLTGVMISDYVRHGIPMSPFRFANQFYLHYPKIAFGSWPP